MKTLIFLLILGISFKVFFLQEASNDIYKMLPYEQYVAKPTIIFIPGYYGSSLREIKNKKRYFINPREILYGSFTLSLHRELNTPPARDLEVEGVIGGFTIFPHIFKIDAYSSIIEDLKKSFPGSQIIPFAYDWREDLVDNADRLSSLVNALTEKKAPSISIVAHSMGGLIATHYLAYGDSKTNKDREITWAGAVKVPKVVLMGVPFGGVMSIFRNMQYGANFLWNKNILQADTVSSFPASYYLIPRFQTKIFNTEKTSLNVNLFDPQIWIKANLGLMRPQNLSQETKNARARFTAEMLDKSLKFSDHIQLGQNYTYPMPKTSKVLNIVGQGIPTLDGGYYDKNNNKFLFFKNEIEANNLSLDLIQSDGDGTVTLASAETPLAMHSATTKLITNYRHDKLFTDPKIMEAIIGFLR